MKFIQNPFIHGKVVSDEQFINRGEEIRRLTTALRGHSNILITGDRRIGKTSLIHKVQDLLERDDIESFYINLDPITSLDSFLERYANTFAGSLSFGKRAGEFLSKTIKSIRLETSFDSDGQPRFNVCWEPSRPPKAHEILDVLELPNKLSKKRPLPLIVIFDEFQNIRRFSQGMDLIAEMRTAFMHHRNVNYVFMGSETHTLEKLFMSSSEKFFASVRQEPVGLIDRDEFIDYIEKQFRKRGVEVQNDTARAICEWARNIPANIQHFCAVIWDRLDVDATQMVTDDFSNILENEIAYRMDIYLRLWRTINNEKDYAILRHLALHGPSLITTEMCSTLQIDKSTVGRRVKSLSEDNGGLIIYKRRDGYHFSDPFFAEWIRRET